MGQISQLCHIVFQKSVFLLVALFCGVFAKMYRGIEVIFRWAHFFRVFVCLGRGSAPPRRHPSLVMSASFMYHFESNVNSEAADVPDSGSLSPTLWGGDRCFC